MDTGEKAKKPLHNIDLKISKKILFPYPPSFPRILKAFLKAFQTKMKPSKYPAKEKNETRKAKKRGEKRKRKVRVKTAVSLLNPKTMSKFCFLCTELHKLIFCTRIRRVQSVHPVNGFMVSSSSLKYDSCKKFNHLPTVTEDYYF